MRSANHEMEHDKSAAEQSSIKHWRPDLPGQQDELHSTHDAESDLLSSDKQKHLIATKILFGKHAGSTSMLVILLAPSFLLQPCC